MKNGIRLILALMLLSFFLTSEVTLAFSWWQAAASAGAGAITGAIVGSFVPGLGTLLGAGIGALAGFISGSVAQLLASAPSTSSNFTLWYIYAKDVYGSISQQSELIADQEISQVNLLQQAQLPFTITAQKWEQVNYNANDSLTSPYQFYEMLQQTGFLSYAAKLVGGMQALWITEQAEINAVDQQLSPYGLSISYNVNPNGTVAFYMSVNGEYAIIVVGSVFVYSSDNSVTIYTATPEGLHLNASLPAYTGSQLQSGVYVVNVGSGTSDAYITISPADGMALIFSYNGNSYAAANWGFEEPSNISLIVNGKVNESTRLPQPQATLAYAAEQVALSMEGAAQTEYTILKQLGYSSASQIPSNITLPTLNLNIGNFSNFTSSLQAYNLYLAMYTRELLQLEQTLQLLSEEGRLAGLQELTLNATNPLSLYGQYGGFVENGTIILPNGQVLRGLYLIQPYGGPLTLTSTGGTIGSGGAIAYQLVPLANGSYGLGEAYVLQPGTIVNGHVLNPGTLGTVNQPQNANYLNVTTPQMPYTTTTPSFSSAVKELENYLLSHPLVLLLTIFFVLIIIVLIIKAIAS